MINEIFNDYYEDLQVSPNADAETIGRVYHLLARKWHPDNALTGNPEKFNVINEAHGVLSHPEKRAAYDAGYENRKNKQLGMLSAEFQPSGSMDHDNAIRFGILSILYAARRQDTEKPDIGMWRLEQLLGWPEKEIGFHIWYLKEKNWIYRSDTGGFAITVKGAEEVEARKSVLSSDRLITENNQHADEPQAVDVVR
jgi:curved DNA-binding protein CbpA